MMANDNKADWDIDENRQNDAKNNQDYKDYSAAWNEKWQIVKEEICSERHYECEVLAEVSAQMD